ncbi:MAG: J domain-containing protein [Alphaproteobacteria bacterium]
MNSLNMFASSSSVITCPRLRFRQRWHLVGTDGGNILPRNTNRSLYPRQGVFRDSSGERLHRKRQRPSLSAMKTGSRKHSVLSGGPQRVGRQCDHPQCLRAGEYRAPRSRSLTEYYWFCLEHVRDYNQAWNYYAGMSESEIEARIRLDTVWERPTWPMGSGPAAMGQWRAGVGDRFGFFGEDGCRAESRWQRTETPEEKAMRALDLERPLSLEALKRRYKELVKLFHPDIHHGDKGAEETLKVVIEAYKILMRSLHA